MAIQRLQLHVLLFGIERGTYVLWNGNKRRVKPQKEEEPGRVVELALFIHIIHHLIIKLTNDWLC